MPTTLHALAPLQVIMLRDSLEYFEKGMHVEQLEIEFTGDVSPAEVATAWLDNVTQIAVLKMAFVFEHEKVVGWREVPTSAMVQTVSKTDEPYSEWLNQDRNSLVFQSEVVPWRVNFLPHERRWVWTFHHALLDGRSIARIMISFLDRLFHATPPARLALSCWNPPSTIELENALVTQNQEFSQVILPRSPEFSVFSGKTIHCLGEQATHNLENFADSQGVTAATVLTWAWGQAVMRASGGDAAIIEQVRCGATQHGTAGFKMNTVPLVIRRGFDGPIGPRLRKFRKQLLDSRQLEIIPPGQLPERVLEMTNHPWASVIMIEHTTLAHQVERFSQVRSITLHETPGECLTAAAWQFPNLHLEVEGPENNMLADLWVEEITLLMDRHHSL